MLPWPSRNQLVAGGCCSLGPGTSLTRHFPLSLGGVCEKERQRETERSPARRWMGSPGLAHGSPCALISCPSCYIDVSFLVHDHTADWETDSEQPCIMARVIRLLLVTKLVIELIASFYDNKSPVFLFLPSLLSLTSPSLPSLFSPYFLFSFPPFLQIPLHYTHM